MIKRVIGIVAALAAIAVIAVVALHAGRFTSLVFSEIEPTSAVEVSVGIPNEDTPGASATPAIPTTPTTSATPGVQPDSMRSASDSVALRRELSR